MKSENMSETQNEQHCISYIESAMVAGVMGGGTYKIGNRRMRSI